MGPNTEDNAKFDGKAPEALRNMLLKVLSEFPTVRIPMICLSIYLKIIQLHIEAATTDDSCYTRKGACCNTHNALTMKELAFILVGIFVTTDLNSRTNKNTLTETPCPYCRTDHTVQTNSSLFAYPTSPPSTQSAVEEVD